MRAQAWPGAGGRHRRRQFGHPHDRRRRPSARQRRRPQHRRHCRHPQRGGLVGLGRDGRPEARLAERWEVSPDGLTWRFFLRPGLIFQDGEALTAAAAKAAITPQQRATEGQTLPGLRDVVAVEAPGPLEVVVRLKKPNALLLEALNFSPIVSLRHGSGRRPVPPRRADRRQGGARPLQGLLPRPGQPRDHHHLRVPLAARGLERHAAGRRRPPLRGRAGGVRVRRESPNTHVATYLRAYVTALAFNATHPVLGRKAVRQALNFAVDRAAVIDGAVGGRGVPATDHIWPNHWARDAAAPAFGIDADAAASMLDAAGLRRRPGGPAQARLTFTCLVLAEPRFERLALLLQRQLLSVDVDMRLEALPASGLRDAPRRRTVRRVPDRADREQRPRLQLLDVALEPAEPVLPVRLLRCRPRPRSPARRTDRGRDPRRGPRAAAHDARRSAGGVPLLGAAEPRREPPLRPACRRRPRHPPHRSIGGGWSSAGDGGGGP